MCAFRREATYVERKSEDTIESCKYSLPCRYAFIEITEMFDESSAVRNVKWQQPEVVGFTRTLKGVPVNGPWHRYVPLAIFSRLLVHRGIRLFLALSQALFSCRLSPPS